MLNAFDAGRLLPTRTMTLDRREKYTRTEMQRHTMRVVLVIVELCLETIYDNAILRFLGIHLFSAYSV